MMIFRDSSPHRYVSVVLSARFYIARIFRIKMCIREELLRLLYWKQPFKVSLQSVVINHLFSSPDNASGMSTADLLAVNM